MKEYDISVIIPVYNSEIYLKRCIDSVLDQTLNGIEIVLVDDGSTDASPSICDEYARNHENVVVIHKDNAGQGLARNDGLQVIRGRYFAFLDSDDYMDTHAYEAIVDRLDSTGADVCAFGYDKLDSDGTSRYKVKIRRTEYFGTDGIKKFMLHFFGDDAGDDDLRGVSACMSAYKTSIMQEHNIQFPSERVVLSEDTIFNLEYCKYIGKAVTLDNNYYHYCIHEQSHTQRYDSGRISKTDEFCAMLKGYAEYYDIAYETSNRIKMVMWLSIMESIKRAVLQKREIGFTESYKLAKSIVNDKTVRAYITELDTAGFNAKQKTFYYMIRHKLYICIYIMAYIKNKG